VEELYSTITGLVQGACEEALILEAAASNDLWIWHAFGMPGFYNDINVLHRSPFEDLYGKKYRTPPNCV